MKQMAKDFPNNWQRYKDAPEEMFEPIAFQEFMDWKVAGWDIPDNVCCIIRATNKKGKIKEFTYQRECYAHDKLQELIDEGAEEIIVVNDNSIHMLTPEYE